LKCIISIVFKLSYADAALISSSSFIIPSELVLVATKEIYISTTKKVNPGRQGVGQNFRSIGKNASPIEVKFTGKQAYYDL
jgi:hypothetical protein